MTESNSGGIAPCVLDSGGTAEAANACTLLYVSPGWATANLIQLSQQQTATWAGRQLLQLSTRSPSVSLECSVN